MCNKKNTRKKKAEQSATTSSVAFKFPKLNCFLLLSGCP